MSNSPGFSSVVVDTQDALPDTLSNGDESFWRDIAAAAGKDKEQWLAKIAQLETEAEQLSAISELIARLQSCDGLDTAVATLVDELHEHLQFQQVVLGLNARSDRSCVVKAISNTDVIDRRSRLVERIEDTLNESIHRGCLSKWPTDDTANRHDLLVHKSLAETANVESVISSPIRDDAGDVQGAWLFLLGESDVADTAKLNFLAAAERPIGSCLKTLKRAERGRLHRIAQQFKSFVRGRTKLAVTAAAIVLSAILAIPLPYKVKCDCQLQPVIRRYVAAPFEGTLAESFAEPGDIVEEGQLLAEIDGREIRWKLAGLSADHQRAAKKKDSHLAKHDFAEAQLSKFEMERLDNEMQLYRHRAEHLEIRSPIAGLVIGGDLQKAEGVPLTIGQTLFEIAPLDEMIVEVGIPDDEIAHAATGQNVSIALDAFPRREYEGTITKIHPRSEIVANENVFVAEVRLNNASGLLRPGMRGRAKIIGDRHPLGWNLFHKPWEKLVFWLGW